MLRYYLGLNLLAMAFGLGLGAAIAYGVAVAVLDRQERAQEAAQDRRQSTHVVGVGSTGGNGAGGLSAA